jgi:hypothetical protein
MCFRLHDSGGPMLPIQDCFDPETLNVFYRVYEDALNELRGNSEGTTWGNSDDDMIVLANRIFDLAFLGEQDAARLRRGALIRFGYVELGDPDRAAA